MVAELLYRYCEITQAQIGRLLGGIDYVSVNMLRKRVRARMLSDPKLNEQFMQWEERIKTEMYNVKI